MMAVSKSFFVDWYKTRGRKFPWRRKGVSPFALLVTEMLLRQTQATAVSKLWYEFIERYPDAKTLAQANKEELFDQLKILGLGEQRASALVAAAGWLVEHHDGQVPSTKEELLRIPHVGAYVSNAVLCFAFGYTIEVVDTNILRFYARYYGLAVKPDIRRNPEVWRIARLSLPEKIKEVKQHNYGLLDFTAEICRSRMPLCSVCPLASSCEWGTRLPTLLQENIIGG
jgi:A/G-specific adenine glycosylase